MLRLLKLSQFIVAKELELSLGPGLTILTGETGAGKSIILDALNVLCGRRAEAGWIRQGAKEAVVEGIFCCTQPLKQRLLEFGFSVEGDELLIQRSIHRDGRGKIYMNGALATVGMLSKLMHGFVDIAGQREFMDLLESSAQRKFIDAFGKLREEGGVWRAFREAMAHLKGCGEQQEAFGKTGEELEKRRRFLEFQLSEISEIAPRRGEQEVLEAQKKKLRGAEKLRWALGNAEGLLSGEGGIGALLGRLQALLDEARKLDDVALEWKAMVKESDSILGELGRMLSKYVEDIDADPHRLSETEERLDILQRLSRKHGGSLEKVLERYEELQREWEELGGHVSRVEQFAREYEQAHVESMRLAKVLSLARRRAADEIEGALQEDLAQLNLATAQFHIELTPAELGEEGADDIEFLFSAHAQEPMKALSKVASGGELSRLALALRAARMGFDECFCCIFDEADSGVGGREADAVGQMIWKMGEGKQVLCVTHTAQVAAYADVHWKVEKEEVGGQGFTKIRLLQTQGERTQEIARMISGTSITPEGLGAAKSLLREAKKRAKERFHAI
ncbi:MAG: DNA repair protein RecN [Proteobacteria bacterium]|nr:DNA repair protein RecN [Cystobacterineae bacterium]MCL2258970.1 DNA repair protein RecN [Cystobacterineae bacterium]MCL2314673.1 DNA repair protein RecN [Pseudomonadota bacterium]